ncbi:MAG: IPT/TIG domain-containing protein [Candidatus Acidiferrales bacterium]
MKWKGRIALVVLVGATLIEASCGGQINFPTPVIKAISPSSIAAGQPQFTLTVTGGNFVPQSTVLWNGAARVTLFQNGATLIATITSSDISAPGTALVAVTTPAPGGGTTTQLTFTINSTRSPVPHITSISPSAGLAGTSGLTLQIKGSNFVSQSAVTVNGSSRSTAFTDGADLSATLTTADVALAQTLQIGVLNPTPGGGESNAVPLAVNNPQPHLTSVSPTSTAAGGTSELLTLTGTGFDSASRVEFNGSPRTTNFASNTSLTLTLTAADVGSAGVNQLVVVNPNPGGGTSSTLAFDVNPGANGQGLPELVDVAPDGTQANNGIGNVNSSGPVISSNGQQAAFASISNNLVANDTNGVADIFERSTCAEGLASCTQSTTLVSVATSGAQSNADSLEPAMDSTGNFVAFTSKATNLDPNFPNLNGTTRHVFMRTAAAAPTTTTTTSTTFLVSVAENGIDPANADSFSPSVSSDGRYVAFLSTATNLVKGVTPNGFVQVYLRDTCEGVATTTCTPQTFFVSVSVSSSSLAANADSSQPVVATSGLYVAFTSAASNLVSGVTPSVSQIFVRATCANTASCTPVTTLVSSPVGTTTPANAACSEPALTPDGRFFVFSSAATNLVSGVAPPVAQIYMRDTCTGATSCTSSNLLISTPDTSTSPTTPGNLLNERPSIGNKAQFVAFASQATNLVSGTAGGVKNVFVRNTCINFTTSTTTTTCTPGTVLRSESGSGAQGNGNSTFPMISSDGHTVAFLSLASNLVANDDNNVEDIFLASTTF